VAGQRDIESVAGNLSALTQQRKLSFDLVLVAFGGVAERDAKLLDDITGHTDLPVIVFGDSDSSKLAMTEAIWGHLPSDTERHELLAAIRTVSTGQRLMTSTTRLIAAASGGLGLSQREGQVFTSVARGHTNRETAEILGVSVKSVETYRSRVVAKLGVRSRAEFVRVAIEMGLLSEPEE
jgi:DNA-binding NarL/FixJ family response regulator